VTRAAPRRAPLRRWEWRPVAHAQGGRAFVHGPPDGTLADLRLRRACRLNPIQRRRSSPAMEWRGTTLSRHSESRLHRCWAEAVARSEEVSLRESSEEGGRTCQYQALRDFDTGHLRVRLRRPLAKAINDKLWNDEAEAHRYDDRTGGQTVGDSRA
jgi:hypothetical protein